MLTGAAVAAAIALGAPVNVGPLGTPNEHAGPIARADPGQGGWMEFAGPHGEELARIDEAGGVALIALPPPLDSEAHGEAASFTPLPGGWLLAVVRFYPGGAPERSECEESRIRPETCGELAAAELSPAGHWTAPQPLPGSRGESSAADPVPLPGGRVELAWEDGQPPTIRVAVGRLGGRLGHPHVAQSLMRSEPEEEGLENYAGAIFVRGEFGPERRGWPEHAIERRLYGNGSLGPPLFRHGPLIGPNVDRLPRPDGGETYVFWQGYEAGFALRAPGAAVYGPAHLFSKDAEIDVTGVEDRRGRALVVLRAWRGSRSRLIAAEISAHGKLEATHVLETGPAEVEGGYDHSAAIAPEGQQLIVASDAAGKVWAYAAAPRCRRFARVALPAGASFPLLFAGERGVFHLVWEDGPSHTLVTAVARVRCA